MLRFASALAAFVAAAIIIVHPAFRAAGAAGRFVVPVSAAVAATLFACFAKRERLRSLVWFALLVTGQAVHLQLVRAGSSIGYAHLVEWRELVAASNLPWTAFLALQAVIVTVGIASHARRALRWLFERWPGWRLGAAAMLFVVTSAALSADPLRYAGEVALATLVQLLFVATILLAVIELPADDVARLRRSLDRVLGAPAEGGGATPRFWHIDRFAVLAFVWALAVTVTLNVLAYERHPHVPDEVVYLLHARYFADGLLAMPSPLVPDAFDIDLMTMEAGRWYSPVPPGWPAVLAIGAWLGVPWLVNPVLSGVCAVLAYVVLRDVYGIRRARLATILLCASPWFLFMGMSFMTHQFTLAVALAGAAFTASMRRGGTAVLAIPAGVCLGLLALIRPLEGFLAALLFALWVLIRSREEVNDGKGGFATGATHGRSGPAPAPGRRVMQVAIMAAASIATAAATLPYNRYFTGDARVFPIMAYTDTHYGPGSNALGFGANRGLPFAGLDPYPGHGPRDVIVNTIINAVQINTELFGWAAGSVVLIALLVFSGRMARADRWMVVSVLAVVAGHAFYWFSGGPDFGARYWYLVLIPCVALAVSGLRVLSEAIADPVDRARPVIAALALCASALIVFVPWRAADKYHDYRGMQPGIRALEAEYDFGRSLVLVRGRRHPDYASASVYNPVDLHADAPIYAWDRNDELRRRVLEAYRDRPVWIVDGPTRTNDGYRVVAGPVSAEQLIAEMNGGR